MSHGRDPTRNRKEGVKRGVRRALTKRQREALTAIEQHIRKTGMAPSRTEIGQAMELRSTGTIEGHVQALASKGWIELRSDIPRGIRLLHAGDLPIVRMNGPVEKTEHLVNTERTVGRIPAVLAEQLDTPTDYFIQVEGDELKELKIEAGDLLGVSETIQIEDKRVAVIRLGDGIVVFRRLDMPDTHHMKMTPIGTETADNPGETPRIDGIVTGVVKARAITSDT